MAPRKPPSTRPESARILVHEADAMPDWFQLCCLLTPPKERPEPYRPSFRKAIKSAISRPDNVGHLRPVFRISSAISGP
jgi:hypothetical protein